MNIPTEVLQEAFSLRCTDCRHLMWTSAADAMRGEKSFPLRRRDRFAAPAFVVGFVGIFALVPVMTYADHVHDMALLTKPRVNDVYEVDLRKVAPRVKAGFRGYATTLVARVTPDGVDVRIPYQAYTYDFDHFADMQKFAGTSAARSEATYSGATVHLSFADLKQLRGDGGIISVDR